MYNKIPSKDFPSQNNPENRMKFIGPSLQIPTIQSTQSTEPSQRPPLNNLLHSSCVGLISQQHYQPYRQSLYLHSSNSLSGSQAMIYGHLIPSLHRNDSTNHSRNKQKPAKQPMQLLHRSNKSNGPMTSKKLSGPFINNVYYQDEKENNPTTATTSLNTALKNATPTHQQTRQTCQPYSIPIPTLIPHQNWTEVTNRLFHDHDDYSHQPSLTTKRSMDTASPAPSHHNKSQTDKQLKSPILKLKERRSSNLRRSGMNRINGEYSHEMASMQIQQIMRRRYSMHDMNSREAMNSQSYRGSCEEVQTPFQYHHTSNLQETNSDFSKPKNVHFSDNIPGVWNLLHYFAAKDSSLGDLPDTSCGKPYRKVKPMDHTELVDVNNSPSIHESEGHAHELFLPIHQAGNFTRNDKNEKNSVEDWNTFRNMKTESDGNNGLLYPNNYLVNNYLDSVEQTTNQDLSISAADDQFYMGGGNNAMAMKVSKVNHNNYVPMYVHETGYEGQNVVSYGEEMCPNDDESLWPRSLLIDGSIDVLNIHDSSIQYQNEALQPNKSHLVKSSHIYWVPTPSYPHANESNSHMM